MNRKRWMVCLCFLLKIAVGFAQQPSALLKARLEPDSVFNGDRTQLIIEVQSAKLDKLHLELTPPPGFVLEPSASAALPPFQWHFTVSSLSIRAASGRADIRPYTVLVRLIEDSSAGAPLAETTLQFNYIQRLSVLLYFLWGAIGIFLGYTLRLLVKTLQAVPPPPLAPVPGVGPVTGFVQSHYYFVDCTVTLVIGLISMELLLKNNHVPDTGLYWYAALGSGVALGVLTNSDLLIKLR